MEGEERVGFVYSDEAFTVPSIDHEPEVLLVRIEAHGVDEILCPEDFGAAEGEVGAEYTENHVVLRQEDGMEVCRPDGSAGQGGEDGGFACLGGDREDPIDCLPANLEIVIIPIPCDWICARVRGSERTFEVGVKFRLANSNDRFEGCRIDVLESGVVGFEPEAVDFRGIARFLIFACQLFRHWHICFDRHSYVHTRGRLVSI